MISRRALLLGSVAAAALAGCGGPAQGPEDIHWGRDACEFCRMIIDERRFAAEVRGGPRNRITKFDDIGCAVHWIKQMDWRDDQVSEIWVTDHATGDWIDARAAHYVLGPRSPMGYDYAAYAEAQGAAAGYDDIRRAIASSAPRL